METLILIIMYFTIENPDTQVVEELKIAKNEADKAKLVESLQGIVRTLAHICEYGVLGILVRTAFIPYKARRTILIPTLMCMSYSISDEIHQFFVEGRAYQFSDIICDSFGAILGIISVSLICTICLKIREKYAKI